MVEVLSPSTAERDRGIKLQRYRHFGVAEYWIVDLDERTVEVWRLGAGAKEPVVVGEGPGMLRWQPVDDGAELQITVAELFEDA